MTHLVQLAADVDQLREDVDYLATLLEPALNDAGAARDPTVVSTSGVPGQAATPRPGAAHVWHALTVTDAAGAWTELTGWVDWLTDRYRLDDTLPGCWYRHGALVDELDALRAAWTAAYLDPAARPTEAAYWLDLLHHTLNRIRDWDRYGCAAGTHHDDTAPAVDRHAQDARDEHTFADITDRATVHRRDNAPT